jgi:hypothetical protein
MATRKKGLPGRSWLRGEVTLDEVRALVAAFKPAGEVLFEDELLQGREYDVLVVDGPLHVKGDFDSFAQGLVGLVVRGDFTVDGLYEETDDPATGVFVLGDMRAGRVVTTGALCVKGSLTVEGALVGFYNDWSATIGGDLRAACFVPENHFFRVGGRISVGVVVGRGATFRVPENRRASLAPLEPEASAQVLVDEVLEPGEEDEDPPEFDYDSFKARVRKGLPVLRAGAAPQAPARKSPGARKRPAGRRRVSTPSPKKKKVPAAGKKRR